MMRVVKDAVIGSASKPAQLRDIARCRQNMVVVIEISQMGIDVVV